MITTTTTTTTTMTNIKLKIRSIDFTNNVIMEKVDCEKKVVDGRIEYRYSSEYGKTVLTCFGGKLKMVRTGEGALNIYFLENGNGKFHLDAYGLKNTLEVKEGSIQYVRDGKIIVSYKIYNGEELINSLTIELEEEWK